MCLREPPARPEAGGLVSCPLTEPSPQKGTGDLGPPGCPGPFGTSSRAMQGGRCQGLENKGRVGSCWADLSSVKESLGSTRKRGETTFLSGWLFGGVGG